MPVSSLPRAASKPQDGRIGILLPRFSCLACDQTLGKKVWVPYKLGHLYVMSFGRQGWRPTVVVLKAVTLTSVVMSFPPAPSSLLWFLSLRSYSRPSRLSQWIPPWLLSTSPPSISLHLFVPHLLPVPDRKLPKAPSISL